MNKKIVGYSYKKMGAIVSNKIRLILKKMFLLIVLTHRLNATKLNNLTKKQIRQIFLGCDAITSILRFTQHSNRSLPCIKCPRYTYTYTYEFCSDVVFSD